MKKRVLGENGKFVDFKGERVLAKVKPAAQKVAERKVVEKVAEKNGFDASNPAEGGLSEADITLLKEGSMSLMAVVSLANNRGIEIPEGMEAKDELIKFMLPKEQLQVPTELSLSNEKGKHVSKMSIPEMRAFAKSKEIKIPATLKKADEIRSFLLNGKSVEDEL